VWGYLGDQQARPPGRSPSRDGSTRTPTDLPGDPEALAALAEAVAVVAHGRPAEGCAGLVAVITAAPAMREVWIWSLVIGLRRPASVDQQRP
jgi:hypothetical protein